MLVVVGGNMYVTKGRATIAFSSKVGQQTWVSGGMWGEKKTREVVLCHVFVTEKEDGGEDG